MNSRQRLVLFIACGLVPVICIFAVLRNGDLDYGLRDALPFLVPPLLMAAILYFALRSPQGAQSQPSNLNTDDDREDKEAILQDGAETLMRTAQELADRLYIAYPPPKREKPLPGGALNPKMEGMLDDAFALLESQARLQSFLVGYSYGMVRLKRAGPPGHEEGAVLDALFRRFREAAFKATISMCARVEEALAQGAARVGAKFEPEHSGRKAQELLAAADQRRIQYEIDTNVISLVSPYAHVFGAAKFEEALQAVARAMMAYLEDGRLRSKRAFEAAMEAHGVKLK